MRRTAVIAAVAALLSTDDGLLVGSDTAELGREHHGRFGMFPLG